MMDHDVWDTNSVCKLLAGICMDEYFFFLKLTDGLTENELREFVEECPEYKKYYDSND